MERLNRNVGSTKTTLQERPEILHALHVNLTVNILLKVIHELMLVFRFEIVVASELISHNRRTRLNKISHGSMHSRMLAISDHSGFDLSAALKCANDDSLAVPTLHSNAIAETAALAFMHIPRLAANVSFVNLNRPIRPAKFAASQIGRA